jgi:hypothetical protein
MGHCPRDFALGVCFPMRLALVVHLFSAGDCYFDLGPPVLKVQTQRHQRKPSLRRFPRKLLNLTFVEQ